MGDLKRYRHGARNGVMTPDPDGSFVRYEEAAAALEAAREDGLRLEWLADNMHMIAKCGGLWFSSDGAGPYQDRTLRGAIDQARGKAGQEVGK